MKAPARPGYQKFMVDVKASRFDRQGAFAAKTIPQRTHHDR
jgi:hypothetical protein